MRLKFDLNKSMDKAGLVQVQRTVNGKNGTYTRMQWVKASDVQSTDKVVGQQPQVIDKKLASDEVNSLVQQYAKATYDIKAAKFHHDANAETRANSMRTQVTKKLKELGYKAKSDGGKGTYEAVKIEVTQPNSTSDVSKPAEKSESNTLPVDQGVEFIKKQTGLDLSSVIDTTFKAKKGTLNIDWSKLSKVEQTNLAHLCEKTKNGYGSIQISMEDLGNWGKTIKFTKPDNTTDTSKPAEKSSDTEQISKQDIFELKDGNGKPFYVSGVKKTADGHYRAIKVDKSGALAEEPLERNNGGVINISKRHWDDTSKKVGTRAEGKPTQGSQEPTKGSKKITQSDVQKLSQTTIDIDTFSTIESMKTIESITHKGAVANHIHDDLVSIVFKDGTEVKLFVKGNPTASGVTKFLGKDVDTPKFSSDEFSKLKTDRPKAIQYLKDNGITWKENPHDGINWMRACMAAGKAQSTPLKKSYFSTGAQDFMKSMYAQCGNDKDKTMCLAKSQGITWEDTDNKNINWMRATLAIQKYYKSKQEG